MELREGAAAIGLALTGGVTACHRLIPIKETMYETDAFLWMATHLSNASVVMMAFRLNFSGA